MSAWRLLWHGPGPAAWNMAVDEAILLQVGKGQSPPTLRLYAWAPPAVSVGYAQAVDGVIDRAVCRRLGIDLVRRITGGRAVLHDDEVTYSVVVPEGALPGGVLAAYRRIAGALAAGLRLLGAELDLADGVAARGAARERAACYAAAGRYELAAAGRKLVGSAQARRWGAVLQHGSIPLSWRPMRLAAILNPGADGDRGRTARLLAGRATDLAAVLGRTPAWGEVAAAVAAGFQTALDVRLVPAPLSHEELALANRLSEEKYASEAWNLRR